jgi:hypothetical protein
MSFMPEVEEHQKAFRCDDIPVEVITAWKGREVFPNLAAAREVYPDLDLHQSTARFTWAMLGKDPKTGQVMARFECWASEAVLSR